MPEAYTDESGKEQTKDERYAAALERYKDDLDKDDANPFKEQDAWEAHQSRHAKLGVGAESGRAEAKARDAYDFVFEDQVEFIKEDLMAGNLDLLEEDEQGREARLRELEEKTERERMRALRERMVK